ncbi:hypothetical protein BB560_001575 [Smittium megazygosporum]|uniref:tRNA-binding domain-containing protein n=1 Tax=Smittium megazygosporum TaxID=133381 RepID=A0A2T9ZH86_9FUNG|nr:hypothetical protein BB560_001575 [Smittium megazygosporum]
MLRIAKMSTSALQNDIALKVVSSYFKLSPEKLDDYVAQHKLENLSLDDSSASQEGSNTGTLGVNTLLTKISLDVKPEFLGSSPEQQAKCVNNDISTKFLVSDEISLCDLVALANISGYMETLSNQKRKNLSKFTDWYSKVQEVAHDSLVTAGINLQSFNPGNNQEKSLDAAAKAEAKKKAKEGKKAQKKGQNKQQAQVAATPSMLDLRVGKIVHVEKHPDADSLYLEKIDIGEAEPRQVISGLVNYIPIEEMKDRMIIAMCNFKPAVMRGITSYAMVLCADSPDGKKVEFVEPPPGSKPGDRVVFEDFEGQEPDLSSFLKKKSWETIQKGLFTDSTFTAGWYDEQKVFHKLLVNGTPCQCKSIADGILK